MPAPPEHGECVVTVEFLGSLHASVGGPFKISLSKPEATLGEVVRIIEKLSGKRLYNTLFAGVGGEAVISPKVIVFINRIDARLLGGPRSRLSCGDSVAVVPVIHGG